jgi:diguanylate cyclase (GGDEF)-like protein
MHFLLSQVSKLFTPTPEYLARKRSDHNTFIVLMNIVSAVLGCSFWAWDYVTDPVGAGDTIMLRLTYLVFLINVVAIRANVNARVLTISAIGMTLASEVVYVEVLNRLNTGMVYGIGGFTFFLFLPVIAFLGYSLRSNLFYTLAAVAIPQILGAVGFAHNFPQAQYAILLWPAAIIAMSTQVTFALNYRLRYDLYMTLERMSNTDPLTSISNRRHFIPLLDMEMERSRRNDKSLTVLMLDIDHFKKINDTYGHATGDTTIRDLANICKENLRKIDIVARLGGEEFAILLLDTGIHGAEIVAEHIRKAVSLAVITSNKGEHFGVTVSIGVAALASHRTPEELLAEADQFLYKAKRDGRNQVISSYGVVDSTSASRATHNPPISSGRFNSGGLLPGVHL